MTQPAKHTPGPWAVDSEVMILANVPIQRIRDSNGREVMRVQSKHVHLVAAAPAMYAAMGDLISLFDMRLPNGLALNQVLPKNVS